MEGWNWILFFLLGNWYTWPLILVAVYGIASPFLRSFRLWQAKRRFIRNQGAKLLNPQNADARFQLANIYAEGKSWRRSLEYASEAVKVAEENPLYEGQIPYHFLRLMGDAQRRRGLYAEAAGTYERALKAKSDLGHGEARFGLGVSMQRTGRLEAAFDMLNRSIEEHGSNLEAYFRLAQVATDLGRLREADVVKREFWKVVAALPSFAGKHRLRWRVVMLLFPLTRGIL
jgi:tetratricopeptide (TPR) repeat protein